MNSYCVFNIGEQRVGINMRHVREIIDQDVIECVGVPLAPAFMRGLFNLRGQVLPWLNLAPFVGARDSSTRAGDRAVIVERGEFRFATVGQRIETVDADEESLQPVLDSLHPALDGEVTAEAGSFQLIHLDRLEACLTQSLKFAELGA